MSSPSTPITASDLLAVKASMGDAAALSKLYEDWSDRVYRWVIVRSGGRQHPAEDICSEVWLRVSRLIRGFVHREGTAGFVGWLSSIVRSCVNDAYRRSKRRPETPEADMLGVAEVQWTTDAHDRSTGLSPELAEALKGLSLLRQRVVTLRFYVGLTVEETAEALDTTPQAVRSAQCKALAQLRKDLGAFAPAVTTVTEAPLPRGAETLRGADL